jgi:hypothetical protein
MTRLPSRRLGGIWMKTTREVSKGLESLIGAGSMSPAWVLGRVAWRRGARAALGRDWVSCAIVMEKSGLGN